jgi:uncharacterized protein (DUF2249 family)
MTDSTERPDWLDEANIVERLDAREMIASGEHPLDQVLASIQKLESGKIFMLVSPFTPKPMIEKVRATGDLAWSEQVGPGEFKTYYKRGD